MPTTRVKRTLADQQARETAARLAGARDAIAKTDRKARTRPVPTPSPAAETPQARRAAETRAQQAAADGLAKTGTCQCGLDGCQQPTNARFAPGHDARLKSALINVAIDGKTARERQAAEKRIASLGWEVHLEKSRVSRAARAERARRSADGSTDGKRSPAQVAATARMRASTGKPKSAPPSPPADDEDVPMADEVQGRAVDLDEEEEEGDD